MDQNAERQREEQLREERAPYFLQLECQETILGYMTEERRAFFLQKVAESNGRPMFSNFTEAEIKEWFDQLAREENGYRRRLAETRYGMKQKFPFL